MILKQEKSTTSKKTNVRRMTIIAMLSAISILMSLVPMLGYIPIGPTSATIMHIPVIIGAIMEGPVVGASVGFIFGLTSLIKALTAPTVTSFAFINPLVSILPRIIIGIASYYVYVGVVAVIKNKSISAAIAGALGSLVNTVGVLGMIYVLYAEKFVKALGITGSTSTKVLVGLATTSGIPEAIVAALVVMGVISVLKLAKK